MPEYTSKHRPDRTSEYMPHRRETERVLEDKNTPAPGSTERPCAGGDENAMSMPAGDGS